MPIKDLTGQKFGKLEALYPTEGRYRRHVIWMCKCDCGNFWEVTCDSLAHNKTTSCGCIGRKSRAGKKVIWHGESDTPLHRRWKSIKRRCYNPNFMGYKYYGGKGIIVCKEWRENYVVFRDWALANGFEEHLEIDRIDPTKGYSPENCRWITQKENSDHRHGRL